MPLSSRQTQPLWPDCPTRAVGERIPRQDGGQGCKILMPEWDASGMNVYRVYLLDPVRACPECGHYNPSEDARCQVCGRDLTSIRAAPAVAILYEACDVQRLAPFIYLLQKGVRHPCLLTPFLGQSLLDGGNAYRYQLFMADRPAPPLQERDAPAPLSKVLRWGMQIAQGLTALHKAGFAHGIIDRQHILVRNDRAWLVAAPGPHSVLQTSISQDLSDLATALVQALGLSPTPQGLDALPPPVRQALAPALNRTLPESNAAAFFVELLTYAQQALHSQKDRRLQVAWATDVGRQRPHNEDSLLTIQVDSACDNLAAGGGVFLVADGAGGHQAGEMASQTAVQIIGRALAPALADFLWGEDVPAMDAMEARMQDAIHMANTRLRQLRQQRHSNMLTTVALVLIRHDQAILAHIGDSRIYLWREGGVQQLTSDHTTVQKLIDMGQITPEEARTHPRRHELYRALGYKEDSQPDLQHLTLQADDTLLLCSDGLYDELDDAAIAAILADVPSLDDAARHLIQAANDAGGSDNISVILVRVANRESRV